ncbi:DUF5822 domain-containing protein [Halomarina halobia]|uniref:DUF5822 domain-containing protein n=1 Tax=Halomarina halobia TaxID=3033386 RepID=A0ABD6A4U2_9EURY
MQTTFVLTIVVGAPVVAALSLFAPPLETWGQRAEFAVRVGALVWLCTATGVYLYARRTESGVETEEADAAEAEAEA